MSFSTLRDIFTSRRLDVDYAVRSLLFLESPSNVKEYLTNVHLVAFHGFDLNKEKRWRGYPCKSNQVAPIIQKNLTNPGYMNKYAAKLSFDISRFMEFLDAYTK